VLALAMPAAGCAFSYQLGSMFGEDEVKLEHTGSLAPKTLAKPAPVAADGKVPEADLAYARAAAVDLLSRNAKASAPWENPKTGARGSVTPIAQAYAAEGTTCRDFLASYVSEGGEAWMQGAACRTPRGKWEVRNMRPWKRT
jgi:hypothetical protein